MYYLMGLVVVGVGCFILGALVYRKNAKKFEAEVKDLQAKLDDIKSDVKGNN